MGKLTDMSVMRLARLSALEAVVLSRTDVTFGSLRRLSAMTRLRIDVLPARPKVLVRSCTVAAGLHSAFAWRAPPLPMTEGGALQSAEAVAASVTRNAAELKEDAVRHAAAV